MTADTLDDSYTGFLIYWRNTACESIRADLVGTRAEALQEAEKISKQVPHSVEVWYAPDGIRVRMIARFTNGAMYL